MENEKNTQTPPDDGWFDNLLSSPEIPTEIGADEQAVSAAGLTHPEDAELEKIISEAKAMDHSEDFLLQENTLLTDPMDTPPTEEIPQELPVEAAAFPEEIQIPDIAEEPVEVPSQPVLIEEEVFMEEETLEPVRKVRPRKKKGYGMYGIPHILSTAIWLGIAITIGVSLARTIWVCAVDVLAFGKPSMEVVVIIEEGDDLDSIAKKLKDAGLIAYPELFKLYGRLTDAEEEIAPGNYVLNSIYDYNALVNFMTPHSAARETVEVMIPEGYSCAQIFKLLEEKRVCSVADLEAYAADGKINDYWFLEGVERGDKYCLEGYLFPDTYEFYVDDDAGRVIRKFLDAFDYRFTDVMKAKLDPLNDRLAKVLSSRGFSKKYIEEHKITIREIVIIASMVEKETAGNAESYTVASVIYNRLTNPRNYPVLNIDATIIYALGGNIDPETGKTKPLTKEDLALDSPYNTYTNQGLPPGPISNPGRNSLDAALDYAQTSYYYYVYNPKTGKHIFATNKEDHDKNVAKVNKQSKS